MLAALSIRDIVLIDHLDLVIDRGMTALTGETGAGKSILLDALGLALGGRGDSSLVRTGAEQGVVTAQVELGEGHAAVALLHEHGIDAPEGELLLRRVQLSDGRSRAFINDQPVSVSLLRTIGALVAEIHGQHDDRAFLDRETHCNLVDAYGGLEGDRSEVTDRWEKLTSAREALAEHQTRSAEAAAEREYLQHSVEELSALAPEEGEEGQLAERRTVMMNAEKFADDLSEAERALGGDGVYDATLNAALRKLERKRDDAGGLLDAACAAMDRVLVELAEAKTAVSEARRQVDFEPDELERAEERLFALRAAARKYQVPVDGLKKVLERFENNLTLIDDSERMLARLEAEYSAANDAFLKKARALSKRRQAAARELDGKVSEELQPLKLERARFVTAVGTLDEDQAGPRGLDRVEFQVATNPGAEPGALMKVASGGELARFILALKVVLAARGSAPTLIFDEVDTAVGGAVSDAIGERLGRLAGTLQVLTVTHSPQVAARAANHILISKNGTGVVADERAVTQATPLDKPARREEVARMLSGQEVTDEARAAADRLLQAAG